MHKFFLFPHRSPFVVGFRRSRAGHAGDLLGSALAEADRVATWRRQVVVAAEDCVGVSGVRRQRCMKMFVGRKPSRLLVWLPAALMGRLSALFDVAAAAASRLLGNALDCCCVVKAKQRCQGYVPVCPVTSHLPCKRRVGVSELLAADVRMGNVLPPCAQSRTSQQTGLPCTGLYWARLARVVVHFATGIFCVEVRPPSVDFGFCVEVKTPSVDFSRRCQEPESLCFVGMVSTVPS